MEIFPAVVPYILAGLLIAFIYAFAIYYIWAQQPRSGTVEWIQLSHPHKFRFMGGRYPLDRGDIAPILIIVALWAVIAFWGLGDREAPQSFHEFSSESGGYVEIDLGEETDVSRVVYYTGLNTGGYTLSFSADGRTWSVQVAMEQGTSDLFKWLDAELVEGDGEGVRYIRVSANAGSPRLGELAIFGGDGELLDASNFTLRWSIPEEATDALFDEQDLVPERSSYLNSSYFDEIYHARTAYEHVEGVYPYEISHPPLGKIIISLGIRMFGMTPFGWRFMGTLFGTIMLACLYCLIKNLFGKRLVAICGTLVFAFDFMHYVQTRIATIDTYAVFFVILMFWFMYRYISLDYETPFRKTLPSLFLCGLFFGIGAACKWTSLYAGIFLVALYAIYQVMRGLHWVRAGRKNEFVGYLMKTLGVSLVFFILIPGIIYYLSYLPYGQARDVSLFSRDYLTLVWDNQKYMFTYHSGVSAEHSFASRWYQWVLDIRPILYFRDTLPDGTRSSFSALGNPAVYWGGLLAIVSLPVAFVKRRDGRALAIFIGYLGLLLPWLLVDRSTFAYHYFTNTIFLVLAIAYVFDQLMERKRGPYKAAIITFTAVTVGLFALFYPTLSGIPVPVEYGQYILKWLPTWPV